VFLAAQADADEFSSVNLEMFEPYRFIEMLKTDL